ncbi:TetR family transcriptional regulator [Nocardioides sp. zg-579]|uniref:TetR family transcriptional regulator n=1 Tax=Nocardioides marmotae TaxID=2663857 RepID=A0A6I3IVR9_9ACTN|nr:TetR family transcriptional regulator [Gordonia jinghuaiqii]MTB94523.1 TetR family transcriptional regulator [Nocardioides marmotae]
MTPQCSTGRSISEERHSTEGSRQSVRARFRCEEWACDRPVQVRTHARREGDVRHSRRPMLPRVETQRVSNRRGRQSREEILDTAARVMGQRGYAATSLSAMSAEIGLAKSVILHHFRTKAGLLSAVMERGLDDFFADLDEARAQTPPDGPPGERLQWFLEHAASVLTARQEFLRLHMFLILSEDEDATSAEVATAIAKVRTDGMRHVNEMIRASFSLAYPDQAQAIADRLERLVLSGIDGAFLDGQADPRRTMTEDMADLAEAAAAMGESFAARLQPVGEQTGGATGAIRR